MRHAIRLILVLLVISSFSGILAAEPITTGTLVREMVDMHRLVEFPNPAYKTVQFSSYDRRSILPGGPGWFANSEGFGNEPVPNFAKVLTKPDEQGIGEYLVCDFKGPGAIVRVWAAANTGTLRMFLDDAEEPTYDGPAQEFLMYTYRCFAEAGRIDEELFVGTFQQRNACYLPIPFAKRCRIVWTGNISGPHFYEIQVRQYEPTAKVVTFQPQDLKTYESEIRRVSKILSNPQSRWRYTSSLQQVSINATVQPQHIQQVLSLDGPKAVERLTLKVSASDLDKALRQTILHIVCDDYPWGQVQSPIGDFFGAAPGINPFNSVPFTVEPNGNMTCRFVMPFAKSLKILLDNRGSQPVTVTGSVLPMDYKWNDATSMHFRARWRVDHGLIADDDTTSEDGSGVQDMPYLVANGKGVYVGTALMLLNPTSIPTPPGNWWGEGDEKIFVDDDVWPSIFGTGTEDYFNYAWASPEIFVHPYCGQPRNDGPANRGFVTNHRWHILDSLPFQRRISLYIELFTHDRTPGFSYARIGYHYGRPGLIDDHVLITNEDVRHLELPAKWKPAARKGAVGYTFHQAEELVQGKTNTTFVKSNIWAGGQLLVWHPADVGEEFTFKLPIPENGKYVLRITTAKTPASGSFSVRLDDRKMMFGSEDGIVDLYTSYHTLSRTIPQEAPVTVTGEVLTFEVVELTKGAHLLTLRYEGSSQDDKAGTVGIDFIWVRKQ